MNTTTNTRGVSEAHLREWAERHGLDGWSLTDLRCAFEDATSMEVTIPTASWRVAGHTPEDARRYAKHLREIHCAHVQGWGVMADMLDAYAAALSAPEPAAQREAVAFGELLSRLKLAARALVLEKVVYFEDVETLGELMDLLQRLSKQGAGTCPKCGAPALRTERSGAFEMSEEWTYTAPPAQPAELTADAQKTQWRIAYLEHGQWSKLPDGLYRVKHESAGTTVLTRAEEPAERVPEEWPKFELWFFRDLVDAQRLKLFGLHGLPVDELSTHMVQKRMLRRLLAMLAASPAPSEGGKGVEG